MTMIEFDNDLSTVVRPKGQPVQSPATSAPSTPTVPTVAVTTTASTIQETVTVTPARGSQSHLGRVQEHWGWSELRDYLFTEIEKRHGPQVRDPKKEKAIITSFMSRYGDLAVPIVRAAVEVHDGLWRSAPITVNRLCKASDPYFADVIRASLG